MVIMKKGRDAAAEHQIPSHDWGFGLSVKVKCVFSFDLMTNIYSTDCKEMDIVVEMLIYQKKSLILRRLI